MIYNTKAKIVVVHKEDGDHFIFQDSAGEKREATIGTIIAFVNVKTKVIGVTYINKMYYYGPDYIATPKNILCLFLKVISYNGKEKYLLPDDGLELDIDINKNILAINENIKIFVLDNNFFKEKLDGELTCN